MSSIRLDNVSKRYGAVPAVSSLDFEVADGEFFSLLGPSGCGKTTTLRMIAGFVRPTAGKIFFGDRDVTEVPPERRDTALVFQSYALFPHMNVFENVAFGLKARGMGRMFSGDREEVSQKVGQALSLVKLDDFQSRPVRELSGGQQQRVALARAVVVEPTVLLLDEPLSNLDESLRAETRAEIRSLQTKLGKTTIYVTHNQEEALSMSDRICVMSEGIVQQIGTPEEVYFEPATPFVAKFIRGGEHRSRQGAGDIRSGNRSRMGCGIPRRGDTLREIIRQFQAGKGRIRSPDRAAGIYPPSKGQRRRSERANRARSIGYLPRLRSRIRTRTGRRHPLHRPRPGRAAFAGDRRPHVRGTGQVPTPSFPQRGLRLVFHGHGRLQSN